MMESLFIFLCRKNTHFLLGEQEERPFSWYSDGLHFFFEMLLFYNRKRNSLCNGIFYSEFLTNFAANIKTKGFFSEQIC